MAEELERLRAELAKVVRERDSLARRCAVRYEEGVTLLTAIENYLHKTGHNRQAGDSWSIPEMLRFLSDLSNDAEATAAGAAKALREMADTIDRGPTFPLPPGVISALIRERADVLDPGGA